MYKILDKKALNSQVVMLTVLSPLIASKVKPGQFVIVRVRKKGERIPLTVADFNREEGTITIVFQTIGLTTRLLAQLNVGDCLCDCVGPLGKATRLGKPNKAIVIGGGVGCAIAYPQAKALFNSGIHTTVVAGFKSKDLLILENEMKAVCSEYLITTDDGSYGRHGFVTDVLKVLLQKDTYDLVIAIGPTPMMKAVVDITKPLDIKTIVSLNPIMIDGTGMCGGCRVTVGGKVKFACVDGPDFDGFLVDFGELMLRNTYYRKEEAHACRMEGEANG